MKATVGKAGDRFGPYELVEHLGGGGNADVWRAEGPHGSVAIKLLRSKNFVSEPYQRFVREVTQLRELGTVPGILPLLDAHLPTQGTSAPRAWLVMPIATPLRDMFSAQEATVENVVEAMAEVAETLAVLAKRGVAHRDIKPGNLYVHEGTVVVGDFGLVDAPEVTPLTLPGSSVGPLHYSAPEMVADASTADGHAADVYSLGKTLWALLARQNFPPPGEHRLDEPSLNVASYLAHTQAASLDVLISRMTRHQPSERPAMSRVAAELRAWLKVSVPPSSAAVDLTQIARRVSAASERARDEEQVLQDRRDAVDEALRRFVDLADPIAEMVQASGVVTFSHLDSYRYGAFNHDASEKLVEAAGMLATTKMLGRKPPVSLTGALEIQPDKSLPALTLWAGIADIPPAAEATFAVGAAIGYPRGPSSSRGISRWLETRNAVLGGPAMQSVWAELVGIMLNRLPEDLAAWAAAVERAAARQH